MTINELNAALDLQQPIDRLKAELQKARETSGVSAVAATISVMGGGDSIPHGQKIIETEEQLSALVQEQTIEKEIIRRSVTKWELPVLSHNMMIQRYVECLPWKEIKCGYAPSQMFAIHKSILEKFVVHRSSSELQ